MSDIKKWGLCDVFWVNFSIKLMLILKQVRLRNKTVWINVIKALSQHILVSSFYEIIAENLGKIFPFITLFLAAL